VIADTLAIILKGSGFDVKRIWGIALLFLLALCSLPLAAARNSAGFLLPLDGGNSILLAICQRIATINS
jgi:hypothetical protein